MGVKNKHIHKHNHQHKSPSGYYPEGLSLPQKVFRPLRCPCRRNAVPAGAPRRRRRRTGRSRRHRAGLFCPLQSFRDLLCGQLGGRVVAELVYERGNGREDSGLLLVLHEPFDERSIGSLPLWGGFEHGPRRLHSLYQSLVDLSISHLLFHVFRVWRFSLSALQGGEGRGEVGSVPSILNPLAGKAHSSSDWLPAVAPGLRPATLAAFRLVQFHHSAAAATLFAPPFFPALPIPGRRSGARARCC